MELVAIDLEGSGAQDRDDEAILEIALVPIVDWQPEIAAAYCTLINPGRPIPQRPWISPGLTDAVLRDAPTLAEVEPELARRINGRHLVGHNVGVDWRLLRRRCPNITPAGLIDTLRLARATGSSARSGLGALVERFGLVSDVNRLATGSAPHRALWDAAASAVLLRALTDQVLGGNVTVDALIRTASNKRGGVAKAGAVPQQSLFDSDR
ncbi:3'-5' exonuclease [Phytohabitans kaempferiae]|uniref:PolC-type DNA polymerase III n=1 Tax=Phytohabitans kaempferiae TaxID=1620943 RepID=A0ABV6M855_9ACTN